MSRKAAILTCILLGALLVGIELFRPRESLPAGVESTESTKSRARTDLPAMPYLTRAGLKALESDPLDHRHFNLRMPDCEIR